MPLNIGIIGCGAIGTRRHIMDCAGNPDVRLVAFCDLVLSRAEEQATKHKAKAYQQYTELLKDKSIDAVIIGTPNATHAPITLAAFAAGKHVLVEKPMAISRAEAEAMIAAGKKAGKALMVGQSQRLMAPHIKAREILRSGRLGKPLTFRSEFKHPGPESWCIENSLNTWFFRKNEAGMGVLGDLGVHKVDLLRHFLEEEFVEVSAMLGTQHKKYATGAPIDVEDNAVLTLRSQSGAMGTVIISWTNYGEGESNCTIIYCEKGVLMVANDPAFGVIVRYANGEEERYKVGAISTNGNQTGRGVSHLFVEAILKGAEVPIPGTEGYKTLNVILTAMESAASQKLLRVPQISGNGCECASVKSQDSLGQSAHFAGAAQPAVVTPK